MIRSMKSRFGRFNGNGVDGLWHQELNPHALGDYLIADVQPNSYLEYQGEALTTPSVTFVGVYDGHGESEVSRFLRENLFHRINNASDWGADISNRSDSSSSSLRVDNLTLPAERPDPPANEKKPPVLSQEALPLEIIICGEDTDSVSKECSICLESFVEGDKLIWLHCIHSFHSICLDPWIRAGGDCPYCRHPITETQSR